MDDIFSSSNRRYPLSASELADIKWLDVIEPGLREKAITALRAVELAPSQFVCRIGSPAAYWLGVVNGLLKMTNSDRHGSTVTFTGLPPGGWFGEGTMLKCEPYRYGVQALRRSAVAGLPVDMFFELLNQSIGFNRFVTNQLNERLSQFIASLESDRLDSPDAQVARCLARLFNPVLFSCAGDILRITQQELAYIVGLSRQRVNQALTALESERLILVEYGGLRVLDLDGLTEYETGSGTSRDP